jgi:ribosomal protein S16
LSKSVSPPSVAAMRQSTILSSRGLGLPLLLRVAPQLDSDPRLLDRSAQTNKPIEVIGTYDPIPVPPVDGVGKGTKHIELDTARAKYWLGVGAQPSDPVWRLLAMVSFSALRSGSTLTVEVPVVRIIRSKVVGGEVAEFGGQECEAEGAEEGGGRE